MSQQSYDILPLDVQEGYIATAEVLLHAYSRYSPQEFENVSIQRDDVALYAQVIASSHSLSLSHDLCLVDWPRCDSSSLTLTSIISTSLAIEYKHWGHLPQRISHLSYLFTTEEEFYV